MLGCRITQPLLRRARKNKKTTMKQRTSISKNKSTMLSLMKPGTEEWKPASPREFGQNCTKCSTRQTLLCRSLTPETPWGRGRSMLKTILKRTVRLNTWCLSSINAIWCQHPSPKSGSKYCLKSTRLLHLRHLLKILLERGRLFSF